MFSNILKISKISLFWTFWKKNWLCLASWALFILKLYKVFQNTVQIAMISKVMIKFWSKFQFQIPLQFYRTVEKVETCDGNGQKFWQVPPSFRPSHFGYCFLFSWLKFKRTEYNCTLTWPIKFSLKMIQCRNNDMKYMKYKHFPEPSPLPQKAMISQNTKFPPTARSPRQTWSLGYSLPHS